MIGSAVQKGNTVYVYDERGRQLTTQPGELMGYTSATFSVKKSNVIYTYDERGRQLSAKVI